MIATRVGGLPEVVNDGKTGILCESRDPDELVKAVRKFYSMKESGFDFKAEIKADSERFSWKHMVQSIRKLTGI